MKGRAKLQIVSAEQILKVLIDHRDVASYAGMNAYPGATNREIHDAVYIDMSGGGDFQSAADAMMGLTSQWRSIRKKPEGNALEGEEIGRFYLVGANLYGKQEATMVKKAGVAYGGRRGGETTIAFLKYMPSHRYEDQHQLIASMRPRKAKNGDIVFDPRDVSRAMLAGLLAARDEKLLDSASENIDPVVEEIEVTTSMLMERAEERVEGGRRSNRRDKEIQYDIFVKDVRNKDVKQWNLYAQRFGLFRDEAGHDDAMRELEEEAANRERQQQEAEERRRRYRERQEQEKAARKAAEEARAQRRKEREEARRREFAEKKAKDDKLAADRKAAVDAAKEKMKQITAEQERYVKERDTNSGVLETGINDARTQRRAAKEQYEKDVAEAEERFGSKMAIRVQADEKQVAELEDRIDEITRQHATYMREQQNVMRGELQTAERARDDKIRGAEQLAAQASQEYKTKMHTLNGESMSRINGIKREINASYSAVGLKPPYKIDRNGTNMFGYNSDKLMNAPPAPTRSYKSRAARSREMADKYYGPVSWETETADMDRESEEYVDDYEETPMRMESEAW